MASEAIQLIYPRHQWTSNVSAVWEFLVSLLTTSYQLPTTWPTTGVVQQSLVRSEASPLPWYPRRVTAKCLSSDGHREVNVLCSSVVRCMFRCRPCQVHQKKQATWLLQSEPAVIHTATDDADDSFFDRIKMNSEHVVQPYLPERSVIAYEKDLIIRLC